MSGTMGFVHDRENASPAAKELMSRGVFDHEAFRRWRDIIEGNAEGRGLGGEGVEHVLGEVGRNMIWYDLNVDGVPAWFGAGNGDARFGVTTGHRTGEQSTSACREGAGHLAHGKDLESADPR